MISCLLKVGELDEAVVGSVELVSLLETTVNQIQSIKEECDRGICNLVEKFLKFKNFYVIFQLLHCRFNLLKRYYTGKLVLQKMCNISILTTKVTEAVRCSGEIELIKKQYEFLDNILLFLQNLPVTNVTYENKCDKVALFLDNYGYCCYQINDYVKAIMLHNQAIASRKLAFGENSNSYKNFANSYNNLGCALENFNLFSEAKTAFLSSIEIKMQTRDYENEEERNKSISMTQNNLQRVENKLKNI